jgi:hypothetical protein
MYSFSANQFKCPPPMSMVIHWIHSTVLVHYLHRNIPIHSNVTIIRCCMLLHFFQIFLKAQHCCLGKCSAQSVESASFYHSKLSMTVFLFIRISVPGQTISQPRKGLILSEELVVDAGIVLASLQMQSFWVRSTEGTTAGRYMKVCFMPPQPIHEWPHAGLIVESIKMDCDVVFSFGSPHPRFLGAWHIGLLRVYSSKAALK